MFPLVGREIVTLIKLDVNHGFLTIPDTNIPSYATVKPNPERNWNVDFESRNHKAMYTIAAYFGQMVSISKLFPSV